MAVEGVSGRRCSPASSLSFAYRLHFRTYITRWRVGYFSTCIKLDQGRAIFDIDRNLIVIHFDLIFIDSAAPNTNGMLSGFQTKTDSSKFRKILSIDHKHDCVSWTFFDSNEWFFLLAHRDYFNILYPIRGSKGWFGDIAPTDIKSRQFHAVTDLCIDLVEFPWAIEPFTGLASNSE